MSTPTTIIAIDKAGSCKTGSLPSHLTPKDIETVLGFPANVADDNSKVNHSWGFTVDGKECGIWDYKGSRWSVYDPHHVLPTLFTHQVMHNLFMQIQK